MNNTDKLLLAIGEIDEDLIHEAAVIQRDSSVAVTKMSHWKAFSGIAAACLLCIIGIVMFYGLNNSFIPTHRVEIPHGYIPEFVGLPVNNFCLSDVKNTSGTNASRIYGARNLVQMFHNYHNPDMIPQLFAIVKVTDTKRETHRNQQHGFSWTSQENTLQVLKIVRNDNDIELPETFSMSQSCYSGRISVSDPTALLRKGGVYLLPLWKWKEWEGWVNLTEPDVLFEIDNQGIVWSHSPYRGFNKFDGKTIDELTQSIVNITEDEDFEIANTLFGQAVSDWGVFAQVTVLGDVIITESSWNEYKYTLKADTIFQKTEYPNYPITQTEIDYKYALLCDWQDGETIKAFSYKSEIVLESGKQYLAIVTPQFRDTAYIPGGFAARINPDGTISLIYSKDDRRNVFEGFEGYTVEQMADIAQRAIAFYERY
jgi:hypothetical protein